MNFPGCINHAENVSIGHNVLIMEHALLNSVPRRDNGLSLRIGDDCYIGRFFHVNAYSSVTLEDSILIADRVYISDVDHEFRDGRLPIISQGATVPRPVLLKKGCWLGVGAVILPGVTVGVRAVVAANAVVTRDVPDDMVARGVPARTYAKRAETEDSKDHNAI